MYYRRYFEGSVEAGTATAIKRALRNKQGESTVSLGTSNPVRNKVIGDALVATLKDCGMTDCYYDETCSYLYFDKTNTDFGIYISYEASYLYMYAGYYSEKLGNDVISVYTANGMRQQTSLSQGPFEQASYLLASNYRFYVTVRGDTAGMFTVYIGSYASPSYMSGLMFTVYRGIDKRNNRKLWGFYMGSNPSTGPLWVYADTICGIAEYASSPYYPTALTAATKLSMIGEWVVLIEMYMSTAGFVVMENTFIDPGYNSQGQFYEIDGDIYFCYTPYLVKCVTSVSTE